MVLTFYTSTTTIAVNITRDVWVSVVNIRVTKPNVVPPHAPEHSPTTPRTADTASKWERSRLIATLGPNRPAEIVEPIRRAQGRSTNIFFQSLLALTTTAIKNLIPESSVVLHARNACPEPERLRSWPKIRQINKRESPYEHSAHGHYLHLISESCSIIEHSPLQYAFPWDNGHN